MNKQHARISAYLDKFESITPQQAFFDLGITKLATRVSEMRRKGYEIGDKWEQSQNRFGEPVRYKKYFWSN